MDNPSSVSRSLNRAHSAIGKAVYPLSRLLNIIGVGAMALVMCFIVVDVLMRKLFNRPILGSYEIVEYGMVVIVFLALAYTQMTKGHISVELIAERFPLRAQAVLEIIVNLIATAFWGSIAIAGIFQTQAQYAKHTVSATLLIPAYPFAFLMAVGCACFALVQLTDVLKAFELSVSSQKRLEENNRTVGGE